MLFEACSPLGVRIAACTARLGGTLAPNSLRQFRRSYGAPKAAAAAAAPPPSEPAGGRRGSHEAESRTLAVERGAVKEQYDAICVGAGHNALTAAAYLAKAGMKVLVVERRHCLGGAAVTEELVPAFHFSRASYLMSLLRPSVMEDLRLKEHGLRYHFREGYSFTPCRDGRYLLMTTDDEATAAEIAKFSAADARQYARYSALLNRLVTAVDPLMDAPPPDFAALTRGSVTQRLRALPHLWPLLRCGLQLGGDFPTFYEILTAPASKVLRRWFDSEPLFSTLATDAVIGAMCSPDDVGSGYVLFHHVMGGVDGRKGAWVYPEGGMGAVSRAIARSAVAEGVDILLDAPVCRVNLDGDGAASGVTLADGSVVSAPRVLSNATPYYTFKHLVPPGSLSADFEREVENIEYTSPVCRITLAVNALPNFSCLPNVDGLPGIHHQATVHFVDDTDQIRSAFADAVAGRASERPVIEMTIPSVLDSTLAPPGQHVVTLFTQYTPYNLKDGSWDDPGRKEEYARRVYGVIEEFCPGFTASIVGEDVLTPVDLEREFGLTGGNIFHGAMALDQLYFARPTSSLASYRTPIRNLYLCGAGTHPGGGVMGAPGRNAATIVLQDA